MIDEIIVKWRSGKTQKLHSIETNQKITIRESSKYNTTDDKNENNLPLFSIMKENKGITHQESIFDDLTTATIAKQAIN